MYAKYAKSLKTKIEEVVTTKNVWLKEQEFASLPKLEASEPESYKQQRLQVIWNIAHCFDKPFTLHLLDKVAPWLQRLDEINLLDSTRTEHNRTVHSLLHTFLENILKKLHRLPNMDALKINLKRVRDDMQAIAIDPVSEELQPLQIEAKKRRVFLFGRETDLKAYRLKLQQPRPVFEDLKSLYSCLENVEKQAEVVTLTAQLKKEARITEKQRKSTKEQLGKLIDEKLASIKDELSVNIYKPIQNNRLFINEEGVRSLFTVQREYQALKARNNLQSAKKTTEDFRFNDEEMTAKLGLLDVMRTNCFDALEQLEQKLNPDSAAYIVPSLDNEVQISILDEAYHQAVTYVTNYEIQVVAMEEATNSHVITEDNAQRMSTHKSVQTDMQLKLQYIENLLKDFTKNVQACEVQEQKRQARSAMKMTFFGDHGLLDPSAGAFGEYLSDRAKSYAFKDWFFSGDAIRRKNYVKRFDDACAAFVDNPEEKQVQTVQKLITEGKGYSARWFGDKKKSLRSHVIAFEESFNKVI